MRLMLFVLLLMIQSCITTKEVDLMTEEVPKVVLESFDKEYPNQKNISWSKEGRYYEAEFEEGNKDVEVLFDKKGIRMETETEIDFSQLPQAIQKKIKENYTSYSIEEVDELLSVEQGLSFEVELKKGNEKIELLFRGQGELKKEIKSTEKEEVSIQRRLYP